MEREHKGLSVDIRLERPGQDRFVLDARFDAPPGVTILFGPSGAGKTTLLAAIAGLIRPRAGRIALGNEVWFDATSGHHVAAEHRAVAMVFQSLALFPHLSASGNVEFGMERSVSRAERRERARALLAQMKVPHLGNRRPGTYSGGEAQRVALARALARQPKLMLLDEPFNALHGPLRNELGADLRALLRALAIPAVLVTHELREARALGDRIVVMKDGRVSGQGTLDMCLPGDAANSGATEH